MRYKELVELCDQDIRVGRTAEVGERLVRLNSSRVPREWRLPLAKICRRSGHYSIGLRLLVGCVRSNKHDPGTPEEVTEYMGLLLRVGAISEAITGLQSVDPKIVPEASLYKAFGHFLRWEYSQSVEVLQDYMLHPLDPYSALVGRSNLAFAHVELRNTRVAIDLASQNIFEAAAGGHFQLQSNNLALRAQVHVQEGNFASARRDLEVARNLVSDTKTYDQLLVTKWIYILDGLEQKSREPFTQLEQLAVENNDWESLREAELYRLKIAFNRGRFVHLYFGTPFAGFRDLIYKEFNDRPTQKFYVYGEKSAPRMDLTTGEIDGRQRLNTGRKCHQLIEVLLRDLYQPMRVASIFSEIFPGEYFDIVTSPNRVRQIIQRTRQWLEDQGIPVRLIESDGFYSIRIDGNFSFRIPLDRAGVAPHSAQFEMLRRTFGESLFLAREVESKMRLSNWVTRELIRWGLEMGYLERHGDTRRSASYKIVSSKKAA